MSPRSSRIDWPLFAAIMLMLGFGIVLVYSSSFALSQHKYGGPDFFLSRQSIRALFAVACFMVCINIDYHQWGKWSGILYLVAVFLLAALFLPVHRINGAHRWLNLGPLQFQVSDFARIALILFLARKCEEAGSSVRSLSVFIKMLVLTGIVCALILLEPNFSTAAIIGSIALGILFVCGASLKHFAVVTLAAIPAAIFLVVLTPYRHSRLVGFADHHSRAGYQAFQSLVGLGNGGLFGVGLGKGEEKFFYLPEAHTDFIVSILGEEIGFIGLVAVLAVLAFIVYRGMRIAWKAPDRMGQVLAFGFTAAIAIYAIVNAAVASGLVPTTGVPMPFLSYGGMSLIFTMASMGILLNISSRSSGRAPARKGA